MQYWKKDRNYRKYVDSDGAIRYVITVDNMDVDVAVDVYKIYAQADRRERYCLEREDGLALSLERLNEDRVQLTYLTDRVIESAEDAAIKKIMIARLFKVIALLSSDERELLDRLYFQNIPAREVAREKGVYHRTILYHRDKILKKMNRMMGE